jgi:hypothetical protein
MGSDGPDLIIWIYTAPATTLDVVVATMATTKSFVFFFKKKNADRRSLFPTQYGHFPKIVTISFG